ncbi:aldo/keto reductase [Desertivirga arenae]|uniref:aldo/keto reductase n=1 Tax=Desertivirga arenae TaxID=2810309 RepID=UPI001A9680BC|nr:aldo/keto reductase [Pedobacter sp. SYSU D00823]
MKYKLFGKNSGLFVSEFVLGTGMFGTTSGYGATMEECEKIFNAYSDQGGNFIDTSDAYQLGQAEEITGKLIVGRRSNYVIASKYSRGHALASTGNIGNHRKALREGIEASLKRLKTDYIDLYLVHFEDKYTPLEEIVRGMEDLVQSGKVLYWGLSNFSPWRTAAAATFAKSTHRPPLTAIQIEYNLLQRAVEQEYWPLANEMGLAIMAYSPMAGGMLTSKYRKGESGRLKQGSGEAIDYKTSSVLDVLETISVQTGFSCGQLATAWVRTKGVFPIIGARTVEQFAENIRSGLINLSPEQLEALDEVSQVRRLYPHHIDGQKILTQNGKITLDYDTQLK